MRIPLPQPIQAPQVVALEIPDSQIKYSPTSGEWSFQVFGVSVDNDVSSLKVQSISGVIQRYESYTITDKEIDEILATPNGAGLTRTQAAIQIAITNLYTFVSTPTSSPVVV